MNKTQVKIKVCIDGLDASKNTCTDVSSYTKESLLALSTNPETYDIYALWDKFPLSSYWRKLKNINYLDSNLYIIENDFTKLETFLEENSIDIYHSLNNGFSLPQKNICKFISSINSLYPLTFKENIDEEYYNKFISTMPLTIEKSDKIIANSNFTKNELLSSYSLTKDKIQVVYPKCNKTFLKYENTFASNFLKKHYSIDSPFLLYVGSISNRKNIELLINLFKQLINKKLELKLVIIGDISDKREQYYNSLTTLINKLNLDDNVIFTGVVKPTHMPLFYSSSIAVLDYSEYNSYPLSSVEAICCKAIVICNKTSANLEVLTNSCVFADFSNTRLLCELIEILYTNKDYKDKVLSQLKPPLTSAIEELLTIYS